jgi:hypothetical protein
LWALSGIQGELASPHSEVLTSKRISFGQFAVPRFSFNGKRANQTYIPLCLIAIGIVLRTALYLHERSFWLDEVALVLNIIDRAWRGLLLPLDYNQGAPLGFLFVQKSLVLLFGTAETVLRIFPFACGITSLIVFYFVTRRVLNPNGVFIALSLFALNKYLVYYSAESKQYSSDVLISVSLLLFILTIRRSGLDLTKSLLFGCFGACVVWFSHPAIFILASISTSLVIVECRRENLQAPPRAIGRVLLISILPLVSFLGLWVFSLRFLMKNAQLLAFWDFAFMPFPPRSLSDGHWLFMMPFNLIKTPGGLSLTGLGLFLFLVGCYRLFLEKREVFLLCISPILLTLMASALHLYPIYGRLCLFLTPNLLILVGKGGESLLAMLQNANKPLVYALMALLFLNPGMSAALNLAKPPPAGLAPMMEHIRKGFKEGDIVYVYNNAVLVFNYYNRRFGIEEKDYVLGEEEKGLRFDKEMAKLRNYRRVWILLLQCSEYDEAGIVHYLDTIGKRVEYWKTDGSTGMLAQENVNTAILYVFDLATTYMPPTGSSMTTNHPCEDTSS